jgi:hypothetical protein
MSDLSTEEERAVSATKCPGHGRHWFSVHGQAYLRSPVCVRCGAPNPRPLTAEQWVELEEFNGHYPAYVGRHVVDALRAHGCEA